MMPAPSTVRARQTHKVKSWPDGFRAVVSGRKRFEVRKDDRDYRPGDAIVLMEFDPFDVDGNMTTGARGYTGRQWLGFIGYIQRGAPNPPGFCAFDIMSSEDANRAALALGVGAGQ